MRGVPNSLDTEYQPPMTVPVRHFVVGLVFLLAGGAFGLLGSGPVALAHVHALVLGWVGVTIVGAMTQFVPVWSGRSLHSHRLGHLQLALLAFGTAGFLAALVLGRPSLLPVPGLLVLAGFWTFVYNVGRTLLGARPLDVTEKHFAFALACVLAVTGLGFALALDFSVGYLAGGFRERVASAHATLAVFGFILATVGGASYQLVTMFTRTEIEGVERTLQRAETAGYPLGVVLLAAGRLVANAAVVRVGGTVVVLALAALAAILGRRLVESRVAWTPMLRRYGAFVAVLLVWCGLTLPAWLSRPLDPAVRFGAAGTTHLLFLGVVGAVVSGTLYHVVPFIVWVHRYSSRLGLEAVPMVDDLYDDRVAAADFALVTAGTAFLVVPNLVGAGSLLRGLPPLGGALALVGFGLFAANLLAVVFRHAPGVISERFLAPENGDGPAESPERG